MSFIYALPLRKLPVRERRGNLLLFSLISITESASRLPSPMPILLQDGLRWSFRRSEQPRLSSAEKKPAIRLRQFSVRSVIRRILQRSERLSVSAAASVRRLYTRLPKPISVPVMKLLLSSAGAQKNSLFLKKKCAR